MLQRAALPSTGDVGLPRSFSEPPEPSAARPRAPSRSEDKAGPGGDAYRHPTHFHRRGTPSGKGSGSGGGAPSGGHAPARAPTQCRVCGQPRKVHPDRRFCKVPPLPVLPEVPAEDPPSSDSASFGTCTNEWEVLDAEVPDERLVSPVAEDSGGDPEMPAPYDSSSSEDARSTGRASDVRARITADRIDQAVASDPSRLARALPGGVVDENHAEVSPRLATAAVAALLGSMGGGAGSS